jgi:cyclohexanone monooxygenase
MTEPTQEVEALVVGAGFAGLYMLHRLRGLGISAQVLEAGDGVGGTWYWNRYPGARCDVESISYSFGFDDELQQEWTWTERNAGQPEILRYANHVADRYDLRRDIRFETRVTAATYEAADATWLVTTDAGDAYRTPFLIMATGCLSLPKRPDFPGLEDFQGDWYHTGDWPPTGVDFTGKRVGIIGTGSSAIQAIPIIAEQAEHLTVFQRRANFTVPAQNHPLSPEQIAEVKATYPAFRDAARRSGGGVPVEPPTKSALEATPEERTARYEALWQHGGAAILGAFTDLLTSAEANETACEFIRDKIRSIVRDPATAELLASQDHPMGTKRLCRDTGYYETYNRDDVTLVGVKQNPIERITPTGLRLEDGAEYAFDVLVLAIGFDAMTGALLDVDLRGRDDRSLRDAWADGPMTYLGLQTAGFPNLFTITGPGSPSVLSNMIVSIEQHVDWIADCLAYMRAEGIATIETTEATQEEWMAHVAAVGDRTLFPRAASWYMGANVPGKPRVFMPYIGGVGTFRAKCDEVAANGYEGFVLGAPEPAAA